MKKRRKLTEAPDKCPRCGNKFTWAPVDPKSHKGFSVKQASIGILLLGPLSLIGGSMGRKARRRQYYYCEQCGFDMEYADKRKGRSR
ncbi:hypothetical protein [uncultured Ruminococcus sp.]|uniref:hypothetical protein n=1 Tax=uncultured Ruminococcus sp. TaxID=165186 RepID=UPI00292DCE66|nr:hypothetical protein [uncultured Ruminococcus sp.]